MLRPSAHLAWWELACHDAQRTPYPRKWRRSRAVKLGLVFENIRRRVGRAITVGCGYRTPQHNRHVGGATKSQHPQGRAFDLYAPRRWTRARFHALLHDIGQADMRIGAIGYYRWGVHVDTRTRGRRLIGWGSRTAKIRV